MAKSRPHSWIHWPTPSRSLCAHCGLVWLKNDASDKSARASCPGKE